MKKTIFHLAVIVGTVMAVLSCSSGGTDGSSGGGMGCGGQSQGEDACNAHCGNGYYQKAGDCVHCYQDPHR